ncbi:MAG: hypothetical protein KF685_01450 [Acidobacteria bacterium]|nr:hypothetical protein [Acidobacteriota bacterium]
MSEKDLGENNVAEMAVNDLGRTKDGAVVVEEANRTVLLTEDETVIIEKASEPPPAHSNRPRKVYGGMWGPVQLAVFGVALLSLVGLLAFYLMYVRPSAADLENSRSEAQRLEADLISARTNFGDISNIETRVAQLASSVDQFETYLPPAANGRTAIYQRLNGLMHAYGLVNTSGPTYAPLEPTTVEQRNQSEEERGRGRFRSLFPGVYMTMTVEGPYQNIRGFIRALETGNEFVVISSVELAPSESTIGTGQRSGGSANDQNVVIDPVTGMPAQTQPNQSAPQERRGRTLGERVALRLEMAAYFRRHDMNPVNGSATEGDPGTDE